jgi:SAM-dependent methyltransferase
MVRGGLRLLGKMVRNPRQGLRDARGAIESIRMRLAKDSTFRRRDDLVHASSCPARMIEKARELWSPRSVVDVGCGTGQALAHWLASGVSDAVGLEGSRLAIEASPDPSRIRQVDLSKPYRADRKFDLVYCVEVAEHIHGDYADTLVDTLASLGDRILMTAAQPGQGGLGHLNEQPRQYWIDKFERRGFQHAQKPENDIRELRDLYWENVMVLERSGGADAG